MNKMWLILISLVIIWIAPIPFMVRSEKKNYNNGKCMKRGEAKINVHDSVKDAR